MLRTILSVVLATSATAWASVEQRQTAASDNCTTGVHMIVARATGEAPGIGALLVNVIQGILDYVPGSDYVGVDYPANWIEYGTSVSIGVANTTKLIQEYAVSCPDSKIVLLGYSQGAQVIGDTLCGITSSGFPPSSALSATYSSNIIAVIQMGDPAHVAGLEIDVGTATANGIFPRTSDSGCLQYSNKTQAYCDAGDAYCDSGLYLAPHYQYINIYGVDAVEYVAEKASSAGLHASSTVTLTAFSTSTSSFAGFSTSTGFPSSSSGTTTDSASSTTTTAAAASSTAHKSAASLKPLRSMSSYLAFLLLPAGHVFTT